MKAVSLKALIFDILMFSYLSGLLLNWISPFRQDQTILNVLVSLVAGTILSRILRRLPITTLAQHLFDSPLAMESHVVRPWYHTFWGWQALILFLTTLVAGLQSTGFSFVELTDADGFAGAVRLFQGLASPNFQLLPEALAEIVETVFIAFIATTLATPIAFLLAFVCAKNIMSHPAAFAVYAVLRTILNFTRSMEPLIWAIIFSVWVGIGAFAGMLALWIHSVASLAKQYSEILESADPGPIDGIRATGANPVQVVWFGILPQVILPYLAFTIYRWDINVRMATIIGLVGGGGIGTMLIKYQGQAMWPEVGCIVLVIAVVVWGLDTLSAQVREALK